MEDTISVGKTGSREDRLNDEDSVNEGKTRSIESASSVSPALFIGDIAESSPARIVAKSWRNHGEIMADGLWQNHGRIMAESGQMWQNQVVSFFATIVTDCFVDGNETKCRLTLNYAAPQRSPCCAAA
jgi:hypothetical protein